MAVQLLPDAPQIRTYWEARDAMRRYDALLARYCSLLDRGYTGVAATAERHLERFPLAHVKALLAQGGR